MILFEDPWFEKGNIILYNKYKCYTVSFFFYLWVSVVKILQCNRRRNDTSIFFLFLGDMEMQEIINFFFKYSIDKSWLIFENKHFEQDVFKYWQIVWEKPTNIQIFKCIMMINRYKKLLIWQQDIHTLWYRRRQIVCFKLDSRFKSLSHV